MEYRTNICNGGSLGLAQLAITVRVPVFHTESLDGSICKNDVISWWHTTSDNTVCVIIRIRFAGIRGYYQLFFQCGGTSIEIASGH